MSDFTVVQVKNNLIVVIPFRTHISLCYAQELPCVVGWTHLDLRLFGVISWNNKKCCPLPGHPQVTGNDRLDILPVSKYLFIDRLA